MVGTLISMMDKWGMNLLVLDVRKSSFGWMKLGKWR